MSTDAATLKITDADREKLRAARDSLEGTDRRIPPPAKDGPAVQWWTDFRIRIERLEKLNQDQAIEIIGLKHRLQSASEFVATLIKELRAKKVIGPTTPRK